jgi:transmembrane sensor
VAGGVALAAAAAVLFFVLRPAAPVTPIARFEVRDVDSAGQRGTLEEGSELPTGPGEVADVRIADSRVHLEPDSRLRIATLAPGRLDLELRRGEVRVGFHPRERGREHLTVATPEARVEVVGTVFTVRARDGVTEVRVSEGTVRVVPRAGGEARLVHAGESTRMGSARAEAPPRETVETVETEAPEHAGVEAEGDPTAEPPPAVDPSGERAPAPRPRALLARARRLLADGRGDRAEPILRRVADGSGPARIRAEAWTLVGDLSQRSGRLDQASGAYGRAAELGRGSMVGPNAIYALGRLQERRLDDAAAARRSYARYLDEAPEGPLAAQARRALCRLGEQSRCEGDR